MEMCRCCGKYKLPESKSLIALFDPKKSHVVIENIKNELRDCWKIQVAENDGLPQHVCESCFSEFKSYFSFRANSLKAQNRLNLFYGKMSKLFTEISTSKQKLSPKNKSTRITEEAPLDSQELLAPSAYSVIEPVKCTGKESELLNTIEFIAMPSSLNKNYEKFISIQEERISCSKGNGNGELDPFQQAEIDTENNDCLERLENDESAEEDNAMKQDQDEPLTQETITYRKLKKNPFSCKYCCFDVEISTPNDVIFPSKEALSEHIEKQHDPKSPYTCPICSRTHRTLKNCRWHILYEHKKKTTICQTCGKVCNFTDLKTHVYHNHTISDYKCETCGKEFRNISLARFEYHQRWHKQQCHYKCKFCGKVFIQSVHLKVHMLMHTKDYSIKCEDCGKGFKSQYAKGIHMYKIHGESKPVKCLYCDERFLVYSKRVNHMVIQHGYIQNTVNEQLTCLKCNKVYRRETGLRRHLTKGCPGPVGLKKIALKPKKNFECQHCARQFGKQSALFFAFTFAFKRRTTI